MSLHFVRGACPRRAGGLQAWRHLPWVACSGTSDQLAPQQVKPARTRQSTPHPLRVPQLLVNRDLRAGQARRVTCRIDSLKDLGTMAGDDETVMGTRQAKAVEELPPELPAGSRAESVVARPPHHLIDNSARAVPPHLLSRPVQTSLSTPLAQALATRLLKC